MTSRIYSVMPLAESAAQLIRTFKPHTAPVVTTAVDTTGTLLATGAADGSVKVWDIRGGYVTHTFHSHAGVVSALCFFEARHQDEEHQAPSKKRSRKREFVDDDAQSPGYAGSATAGFRLASGSEDGRIRVWDLNKRKSVASLESHVSVIRGLSYSPSENALLSASRDKSVIVWDARTWKSRRVIPVLESVEAATFVGNSGLFMVGGENGKLRVWDCNRGSEVTRDQESGPEFDAIVAILYSPGLPFAMTVHSDQTLRLHSLDPLPAYRPGSRLDPLPVIRRISGNDDEIIDLAYVGPDRSSIALATNTESIRIVSIGPSDNRPSSKASGDFFGVDVAFLEGHEDIIICVDVDWSGHWLATGAKDNTARLWRLDPKIASYTCFAILTGHAESIGAVGLPHAPPQPDTPAHTDPVNHPPAFLLTGSQDRTIKRWDMAKLKINHGSGPRHTPKAIYTRKAHEKDINSLDVNHSSTVFASASQDRTVKIWSAEEGSVVGILRGHKRGVWAVRFAPRDMPIIRNGTNRGLVATGSGDKTIKVWSLSDFSCLLTFEGHSSSVLKVIWFPPADLPSSAAADDRGEEDQQNDSRAASWPLQARPLIASAGADGLVKVWSPYTGELETTLDNHTDRVWALASPIPSGSRGDVSPSYSKVSSPFSLASGSADSTVTFWTDTTSATYSAAVNAKSARIEQDQQLQNYIVAGAYREAITLALQLNHPGRLLSLFAAAFDAADDPSSDVDPTVRQTSLTGNPSIDQVLQSLDRENLRSLLLRVRDWNTNARTSRVAQRLLFTLFKSYPASTFVDLASTSVMDHGKSSRIASGMKDILHALTAYTERHYRRIEELADESYLVEWVLGEMDGGIAVGIGGLAETGREAAKSMNGKLENGSVW